MRSTTTTGALRLLLVLGLLVGWGALAVPAAAHGGNFRSGDPDPGPVIPESGEPPPPPTITPSAGRGQGRLPGRRYDWTAWWRMNIEAWEPPRGTFRLDGRVTVTPSEPRCKGAAPAESEADATQRLLRDRSRTRLVLPYIREVVAPASKSHPTLVAAALIAWARMADDRSVLPVLRHYALSPYAPREVRESAVLGFGLLRRTGTHPWLEVEDFAELRTFLLGLFDDARHPTRIRSFAVYAIGLLADQPYGEGALQRDGRAMTRALWTRLKRRYAAPDLPVALLNALGLQPPEGVPDGVRHELRRMALKGRGILSSFGLLPSNPSMERSHALHAYARLGAPDIVAVIRHEMLEGPKPRPADVQASGAIALADVAAALAPADRKCAVGWLLANLDGLVEPRVVGLAYLALGALLRADLMDGSTLLLEDTDVARFLTTEARKGHDERRPYAALALAVASRIGRPASRAAAAFREEACKRLDWAVRNTRGADDEVAPHVAAVGLGQVEASRPVLLDILATPSRSPLIRGFAARALGALGERDPKTVKVLLQAATEMLDYRLQMHATRALGVLAAPGACDALLEMLHNGDPTRGSMVSIALSLGRLGDPKAVVPLLGLAGNAGAGLYVRASAIVSLGLIFDPEVPPSRVRLRTNAHYVSRTSSLVTLLGIY